MNYTSLCYIPARSDNGQYWVQRIADLQGDNFVPFVPHDRGWNIQRRPENMDRFPIMNPAPLTSGQVGVFDWNGEWNQARARTDISSVWHREDCSLIQVIATNFNTAGSDENRVLAIADRLRSDGLSQCLYASQFLVRVSKGNYLLFSQDIFTDEHKLKESTTSCQLVTIGSNAVRKASFTSKDGRLITFDYYTKATVPSGHSVPLYESMDLIRNLIAKKVSWPVVKEMGFTKAEKKTFDSVLQKIDLRQFEEELAQQLGCSRAAAELELKRFRENAAQIDILDGDDGLLIHFFKYNDIFRKMSIDEGERRWREQNESVIQKETEKKNAVLSDLGRKVESCATKVQELEEKLEENDGLIREQERKIQQKKDELYRTEIAVTERLSAIRADIPKAFAELSILKHLLEENTAVRSPSGYKKGEAVAGEMTILDNPRSAWMLLSQNLKTCGCSDTKALIAALWLLACVIRRHPLLLVGASAESFAQAISQSLFGMKPSVLDCANTNVIQSEDDLIAEAPSVCMVRSPFAADWVGRLPGLFSRAADATLFLGITPFHEDLVMEPPSFFHTMLPFLTDVFCGTPTSIAASHFASGKMNLAGQTWRQLAGAVPAEVEHADALRLTPGATSRIGGIFATMSRFANDLQPEHARQLSRKLGVILPLAVATGRNELVETLVKSVNEDVWGLSSFLA